MCAARAQGCISRCSLLPSVGDSNPQSHAIGDHDFFKLLWVHSFHSLPFLLYLPFFLFHVPFRPFLNFHPPPVHGEVFCEFLAVESASDGSNFSARSRNRKMTYSTRRTWLCESSSICVGAQDTSVSMEQVAKQNGGRFRRMTFAGIARTPKHRPSVLRMQWRH